MSLSADVVRSARRHLRRRDAVMRDLMDEVGAFTLKPNRDRFGMLVRSIISQQISTSAARSIRQRLEDLVAPQLISPESISKFSLDRLRGVGLSPQKASYVLDLATKCSDGTIELRTIGRKSDEAVIAELIQVKGIGRWTAQMFLIFSLGRPDVFPPDDLGVRVALRDRYGLNELPDRKTSCEIAESWRPYSTIATWYCWRSLDLKRQPEGAK